MSDLVAVAAPGIASLAVGVCAWISTRRHRRHRPPDREMWTHVAEMETEIYGDVVSPEARQYAKPECLRDRKVDLLTTGRVTAHREDVDRFRNLVREAEEIKRLIRDIETTAYPVGSALIVAGPDPRGVVKADQLRELRKVLDSKVSEIHAITDSFEIS